MSVTVTIHFPVSDVAKAIEGFTATPNSSRDHRVNEGAGCSSPVRSGDGELMVIDEWETASNSKASSTETPRSQTSWLLSDDRPPEITVFGSIDAPGTSKQAQAAIWHTTASHRVGGHTGTLVRVPNAGRWDSARILSQPNMLKRGPTEREQSRRGVDHKLGPLKTSNKERLHRLRIPKAMEAGDRRRRNTHVPVYPSRLSKRFSRLMRRKGLTQ